MTRAEYLQWCRERAMKEYDFVRTGKGQDAARHAAIGSMLSDLTKHSETKSLAMPFGMAALVNKQHAPTDRQSVKRFLETEAQ